MSVLSGLSKSDFKTASDGLLELSEEKLRSIIRTEPITDVYHVEQTPFARGKFASVRKLRHLVTGEEFAAKFVRKRRRAADTTREIHHEVAVLALCAGCARVVRLHEVYETRSEVAIVLELCAGGELQRALDASSRGVGEGCARRALRHVLEGLACLHARRVAHLDIKPQNLLLSEAGDHLVLCDFGISRAIQPGAHVREILGTRDYVAPEILSYEPLSLAADVWSVGVLAYVLLSGYSPFAADTKQETYLNIARGALAFPRRLFQGVSPAAVRFVRDTLVVDPKGRLTVEECLEHPWLRDVTDLPPAILCAATDDLSASDDDDYDDDDVIDEEYDQDEEQNTKQRHDAVKLTNGVSEKRYTAAEGASEVPSVAVNGVSEMTFVALNGVSETQSAAVNGASETHSTPLVNGHHVNGTHQDDREEPFAEDKPLKHAHARDESPPFPDAPSTPKVLRKSHPPSVLALCKKFQPDYEKPSRPGAPGEPPAVLC